MVGHEVRLIEHMTLDEFRIEVIFAQDALAVLENLPKQGFTNGLKIDQVNGAANMLCEFLHQCHLFFNFKGLPRINRQIDIAIVTSLIQG